MLIGTIKSSRYSGEIERVDLVSFANSPFIVEHIEKSGARDIPEKIICIIDYIVKQNPRLANELMIEVDSKDSRFILKSKVALRRRQKTE